jgi:hypothetical protein
MTIRLAAFTTPLLLVFALSGCVAFVESDEEEPVLKPECPKGQVWDSNQQKCLKQNSSLVPDADRTDYAYRPQEQLQQIKSIYGSICEEYQDLAAAFNDSSKT